MAAARELGRQTRQGRQEPRCVSAKTTLTGTVQDLVFWILMPSVGQVMEKHAKMHLLLLPVQHFVSLKAVNVAVASVCLSMVYMPFHCAPLARRWCMSCVA